MCRIETLGGKSPPGKNRESSCKGYIKWLCMARHETSSSYMLKVNVREAIIRLNKAGKAHDNAITTWHKGILSEIGQQNIKRSMRILRNVMAILYNRLPNLREDSQYGYHMQRGAH